MRIPVRALALAGSLALSGAALADSHMPGEATTLDPGAYSGLWYEVANTPTSYDARCAGGVTARYTVTGGDTITLLNRCDQADGTTSRIGGIAKAAGDDPMAFHVEFGAAADYEGGDGPVNYRILALGPKQDGEYQWAVVSSGGDGNGWILARDPQMESEAFEAARAALEQAGIDPASLKMTPQPPQSYDPVDEQ